MKRKPSPATVISLVALFLSLTGAGFAASRYIITSTHQIKPAVLQQLHGAAGEQGIQGPQGAAGQPGLVDWTKTYLVASSQIALSPSSPHATAVANCNPGDHVLNGGATGADDLLETSSLIPGLDSLGRFYGQTWVVNAILAPGATSGYVIAEAECVSG